MALHTHNQTYALRQYVINVCMQKFNKNPSGELLERRQVEEGGKSEHKKIRNGFMRIYVSVWWWMGTCDKKGSQNAIKYACTGLHSSLTLVYFLSFYSFHLGSSGRGGVCRHLARNTNNINNVSYKFFVCYKFPLSFLPSICWMVFVDARFYAVIIISLTSRIQIPSALCFATLETYNRQKNYEENS